MNKKNYFAYYDRKSGGLRTERVYASAFLAWLYNTQLGRFANDLLFRQKFVSHLYGWFHKQRWSKQKIRPFVEKLNIDMDESVRSIEEFTSFNDFFTRKIDLSKRPFHKEPCVCISPTDSRVLAYPIVEANRTYRIKRSTFNLHQFLSDDGLVEKFTGGSMVINRLYLSDYHHFHFPDSGTPGKARAIQGKYYAVSPYALRTLIPFYTENHRMLTLFDSDHFGQIAMVEIGSFTVGSIQQRYQPGVHVVKGARKGFFELGASTVVLLFQKGMIELDEDLCRNTTNEIETYVRLGDSIGRRMKTIHRAKKMRQRSNMTRIRYAQCWEDPRTLMHALEITAEDDVVSIASGGENSLALLLRKPRSLTVVDINPAQIFLVELKMRAIQRLNYDDFVGFIGARPCQNRLQLYSYLRPSLSDQARGYWDTQTKNLHKGIIHCGKFENYFSVFRQFVLPFIHGKKTVQQLLAASSLEQQRTFYNEVWNNRRWQWLFRFFFGKFLLGHVGRDPSLFQYVTLDNIAEELLRRTRHGLTEIAIQENFFIEYILTGQYSHLEKAHPYLRESKFHFLKEHVGRVRLVIGSLQDYLNSLQPETISKFNLSDIFESMSDDGFECVLQAILRVCRDDAKLAFWTLFVPRAVPPTFADYIDPYSTVSKGLLATDRTFFYGSFGVWHVARGAPDDQRVRKLNTSFSIR